MCEDIGVHLVLKIMVKVEVFCLVEDIGLTLEIVLLDLNQCEVVPAILLLRDYMLVHLWHS